MICPTCTQGNDVDLYVSENESLVECCEGCWIVVYGEGRYGKIE